MEGKANEAEARLELRIADLKKGEEAPRLAMEVLDRAGETIHRAEPSETGEVSLPPEVVEKAHRVTVVPVEAEKGAAPMMVLRADEVRQLMSSNVALDVPRDRWASHIGILQCVNGTVSHCFPFPYLFDDLVLQAQTLDRIAFPRPSRPPFRPRCETVCDGEIVVFKRTCCCGPWILEDPRLDDLIDRLRELLDERVIIKFPPPPPPPPDSWRVLPAHLEAGADGPPIDPQEEDFQFLRGGAISKAALYAERDLAQVQSLKGQHLVDYVSARAYLRPYWCTCGTPQQVATGRIRPDGTFSICWRGPVALTRIDCHDEYAFVVRQNVSGSTITIYDGVAANLWYSRSSGIELVSYDRRAIGCRSNPFPGETGAFVLLSDIGAAESWRLQTPDQDTWDGVVSPAYNDGLLDPAATAAAAKGNYRNSNWGGTLALRYHFSEPLRGVGGRYYRVSAVRADGSGNPTGVRSYLAAPLSWLYFEITSGGIDVQSEALGPLTVGGEANLYRIPYDADHDWKDGQFHGFLDTTGFAHDRHLIMIEVFDASGNRIRPNGSSGPGNDAGFTFRRWYQQIGPTANVPFSALTHMFWWDNRPAVAKIAALRLDGVAASDECQFLTGSGASTFSADYRAYHQDEMFIRQHNLWWKRGLGGATGDVSPPAPSPRYDNVGKPPAAPGTTPTRTFVTMLGMNTRCSFALNLHVDVKTTNGSGVLTYLDAGDQAAFALLT
jgi:hypothetical protein